jgi:hypothetical protein
VYQYKAPSTGDKPDENGITDAMLDFSWERDVEPQVRDDCRSAAGRSDEIYIGNQN